MPPVILKSIPVAAAVFTIGWLFATGNAGANNLPPVHNAPWQQECSACNTLYHPGLLPERSWRKLMGGLDKHFGENASLDKAAQAAITEFLAANAGDRGDARRARKIERSIGPGETPLRISDTPYMLAKHDEIRSEVWKRKSVASRANCGACHPGAERGDFEEHAVRIPR